LAQLRQDYQQFVNHNAQILVVSPEDSPALARYWAKEQLPFVALPDPTHQVADLYGQQVKLLKLGRLPAVLVINLTGQVCYRHYGDSMRDIPPNQEILAVLEQLNQEAKL